LLINFSSAQGLIGSSVNSILINNGRVYAGTDKGITVITPPAAGINTNGKWGVESFGKSYGLNRLEPFSFLTDALTKDGLYCWGDDGISVLDLSKKDTFATATFITGIGVTHNNDTLWDQDNDTHYIKDKIPLSMADKRQRGISWDNISGPYNMPVNLQLPYDQNLMRFNYGNLNLTDHDTTWYRYRLEGAGKNWSPQTTETASGNYFNLTPGKYIFEVSSKTADNGWSTPARLSFTIIPPWWIRWWAWGLYIILLSGVIYAFVYLRSRQLVKEKNKLEREIQIRTEEVLQQKEEIEAQRDKLEMEKIRADIAADFHDELGSTLSSIALYSEMAITDSSADERTKNILSLIGESSRGTVSAMQDMIWTIQPKNDKMQEVIYRMREYAYPLAELKNISLTFDAGENVQDLILSMDIRKNIYLIFKEALNNAFKYASATCITITMFKRDNLLHLEIIDDGAGFDLENAKAGNGLANMHKRAAQAAGTLHIKSFKGRGTEILFSCPVG
jgi:signal transduction histidine kinase